jgi:hypothetical protein
MQSQYENSLDIDDENGVFTLMNDTGQKVGGHAMIAFEWLQKIKDDGEELDDEERYRHDVYHLHAAKSLQSSAQAHMLSGSAVVHKVIRGGDENTSFNRQIGVRGSERNRQSKGEVFKLLETNYIPGQGKSKFIRRGRANGVVNSRTVSVSVPRKDLKYGVLACRLLIMGKKIAEMNTERISVVFGQDYLLNPFKLTNCVRFSRNISEIMGVAWSLKMKFVAFSSTQKAIDSHGMQHRTVTNRTMLQRREDLKRRWKKLKRKIRSRSINDSDVEVMVSMDDEI